ncbi:MAG: hypothetical protein ACRCZO_11080, partial [Cetobacterium sp.]
VWSSTFDCMGQGGDVRLSSPGLSSSISMCSWQSPAPVKTEKALYIAIYISWVIIWNRMICISKRVNFILDFYSCF